VEDVLSYVEYDPRELTNRFREKAERAVREGVINGQQRRVLTAAYEAGLRGYTYYGSAAADVANECSACGTLSDRQYSEPEEEVA
jgi:hypothetical protein